MYDGMPTDDEVLDLQKAGHTFHCAMRILTGDGECECNKKNTIPGPISRAMYIGHCPVCLECNDHKEWCRNKIECSHKNFTIDKYPVGCGYLGYCPDCCLTGDYANTKEEAKENFLNLIKGKQS